MTAAPTQPDDAKHSLLSKAHPVSQTSIVSFLEAEHAKRDQPSLPRSEFGTYSVREVEVQSGLTECQMPGRPWSLNPYTGCSHDCTYCYVPDVAHLDRERWGSYVVVKRNLPRVLSREVKRKEARDVLLSSATDPYQPAEGRHQITRRCLGILARADWPVRVLTRSPLVCRDIELFDRFSDLAVGMSVPTVDDEARALIEPGAPPVDGRLSALSTLAEAGLEPFANLAPAYPLVHGTRPEEVAGAFAGAGVSAVYAGRWRYLEDVLGFLEDRVDGTVYRSMVEAVQDEAYYDRLFAALKGAFRRAGVPFHEMRVSKAQRSGR